ncbi:MAG: hypothetical protein ACREI3_12240 [Nitrospirales bacterium]
MKPIVNRLSSVPLTGLVCCPRCYQMVSYAPENLIVTCPSCGTTVKGPDMPDSLNSSPESG